MSEEFLQGNYLYNRCKLFNLFRFYREVRETAKKIFLLVARQLRPCPPPLKINVDLPAAMIRVNRKETAEGVFYTYFPFQ